MNTEMTGSTRFVPERKPFNWGDFAKKTAVVVGTLATDKTKWTSISGDIGA